MEMATRVSRAGRGGGDGGLACPGDISKDTYLCDLSRFEFVR